jgi:hypothetical protein
MVNSFAIAATNADPDAATGERAMVTAFDVGGSGEFLSRACAERQELRPPFSLKKGLHRTLPAGDGN